MKQRGRQEQVTRQEKPSQIKQRRRRQEKPSQVMRQETLSQMKQRTRQERLSQVK